MKPLTASVLAALVCAASVVSVAAEEAAETDSPRLGERGYLLAETGRDTTVERAILDLNPDYGEAVAALGQKARYLYNRVDLDGDGRDEIVVYLLGGYFCGTGGCNLILFSEEEQGLVEVNNFPASRVPLVVRADKTSGWHDLVRLTSGGGAPAQYHLLQFDGKGYASRGTVPPEKAFEGTSILADDLTAASGITLESAAGSSAKP